MVNQFWRDFWIGFAGGLIVVGIILLGLFLTGNAAHASVTDCPVNASPCIRVTDHSPTKVTTIVEYDDHSGIPICWLSNTRGWKCTDYIQTMMVGSVDQPSVVLDNSGHIFARYGVYVGGEMFTEHDVQVLHCLEQAGQTAASCRRSTK